MSEHLPEDAGSCPVRKAPDMDGVEVIALAPAQCCSDYRQAMTMAEAAASERLGEVMLISWYDRDRDFESPQHAGECHQDSAIPGYVDYALYRGAKLKVDIEQGRFVFFYLAIEL